MGADEEEEEVGPSPGKGMLAVLSLTVFTLLVVIGGVIGLLTGPDDPGQRITTAQTESTTEPPPAVPEALATADQPDDTANDPEVVAEPQPAQVEVLGVTELGLALGTKSTVTTTTTTTTTTIDETASADVEFLELPKAVYDRFVLNQSEVLVINITANDKIGGLLASVEPTGLGELPPGFTLDRNGLLSGSTNECGNWKLQYALESSNPALATSWIDITVGGCE